MPASRDLTLAPGEISALLGQGTHYKGKLTFEGRVRIDGHFEGSIFTEDMLIVGQGAEVRADIQVGTLIVLGGELWGDVRARELVELHAPSKVHGDIETPQIFIDRGVVFEGQCRMNDGAPAPRHALDGAIADALEGSTERSLPLEDPDEGDEKPAETEQSPSSGEEE